MRYAHIKNADLWVIDERETVKLRPQFASLLDAAPGAAGIDLLTVDVSSAEKIAVYSIAVP